MLDFIRKDCRKNYNFYRKKLSNFKTVMKDTNNNLVTANQYDYNCMSYALGVFDKRLILNAFESSRYYKDNTVDYNHLKNVFLACCKELENKYAVRPLSNPYAELAENERMIAFRIGATDFHFARQNSDGTWTHKPGGNHICEMSEEELLSDAWCKETREFPYVSSIAFYAVQIKK